MSNLLGRPLRGILQRRKPVPALLESMGMGVAASPNEQFGTPSFFAPLQANLFAQGRGSTTPTFTRATTATVTDWENIVRPVLSGEARFQGARRVANISGATSSENLTGASYSLQASGTGSIPIATSGFSIIYGGRTIPATRLQMALNGGTAVGDRSTIIRNSPTTNARAFSIILQSNTALTYQVQVRCGAGQLFPAAGTSVNVTPTPQRFVFGSLAGDGDQTVWVSLRGTQNTSDSCDILATAWQLEDVTGQSNVNPGEYVSLGVLSAPYQGANVDGVQYFTTQNGNTVSNNVVTQATGAQIPLSTLLGYLAEGARTNLCLQSEVLDNASWVKNACSISANVIAAPDGNTTADKIVEDSSTGAHFPATPNWTSTLAQYTISFWAKAGERNKIQLGISTLHITTTGANALFTLTGLGTAQNQNNMDAVSIVAYPNGWYRCAGTFTCTAAAAGTSFLYVCNAAGSNSYTGDGASGEYVWGAQIELGAFASSYIPTTTVAVTRNADVLTYASAGNVSVTAGSIYCEASALAVSNNGALFCVSDNSLNNRTEIFAQGVGGTVAYRITSGGVSQLSSPGGFAWTSGVNKSAMSWSSAAGRGFLNGQTDVSVGAITVPVSFTQIRIGDQTDGNPLPLFGTIRNVKIYNTQLPDIRLISMTS